jgi:SHS2 domain-containing protein
MLKNRPAHCPDERLKSPAWAEKADLIRLIAQFPLNADIEGRSRCERKMKYAYTFLEHTADIRILLEGDSFQGLFLAGIQAIAEILKPGFCPAQNPPYAFERTMQLESTDRTALLIDFLSDVLTQCHMDQAIYCTATANRLSETGIEAVIHGMPVADFDDDIKAVTYHEAEVRHKNEGKWSCMVIVDI